MRQVLMLAGIALVIGCGGGGGARVDSPLLDPSVDVSHTTASIGQTITVTTSGWTGADDLELIVYRDGGDESFGMVVREGRFQVLEQLDLSERIERQVRIPASITTASGDVVEIANGDRVVFAVQGRTARGSRGTGASVEVR